MRSKISPHLASGIEQNRKVEVDADVPRFGIQAGSKSLRSHRWRLFLSWAYLGIFAVITLYAIIRCPSSTSDVHEILKAYNLHTALS
ncbi:MAG: hypothetical protein HQ477_12250 [Chloroflexi bacterium]|jgi:hypothetical protein|nr:hypothetical protein [Chloroflexota bacterium]